MKSSSQLRQREYKNNIPKIEFEPPPIVNFVAYPAKKASVPSHHRVKVRRTKNFQVLSWIVPAIGGRRQHQQKSGP
jgi:hypothetical protein